MVQARTETALDIAHDQLRGGLGEAVRGALSALLDVLARLAVQIDFVDEDLGDVHHESFAPALRAALREELAKYTDAELIWGQEEPSNMGPWGCVKQRLQLMNLSSRYTGRPSAASPATGSYRRHQAEEEYILEQAFG